MAEIKVYLPMNLSGADTGRQPYTDDLERAKEGASRMLALDRGANVRVGIFQLIGEVTPTSPAFNYRPVTKEGE